MLQPNRSPDAAAEAAAAAAADPGATTQDTHSVSDLNDIKQKPE